MTRGRTKPYPSAAQRSAPVPRGRGRQASGRRGETERGDTPRPDDGAEEGGTREGGTPRKPPPRGRGRRPLRGAGSGGAAARPVRQRRRPRLPARQRRLNFEASPRPGRQPPLPLPGSRTAAPLPASNSQQLRGGRAGREREGGREGERGRPLSPLQPSRSPRREAAAARPGPALPAAAYAQPAPRPPPPLLPGRRRRCRRPGGARCLHLRRVAPLPTGSPLFHSRLQRRSKSSGAHIGEGKRAEGGTSAEATRTHPTRRGQPRRRGRGARPLHAAAIGESGGTALGFSCAPRLLPSWLEERKRERADVSVLGAGPLPPPPPPVPC